MSRVGIDTAFHAVIICCSSAARRRPILKTVAFAPIGEQTGHGRRITMLSGKQLEAFLGHAKRTL
jgi:hypothetical protein